MCNSGGWNISKYFFKFYMTKGKTCCGKDNAMNSQRSGRSYSVPGNVLFPYLLLFPAYTFQSRFGPPKNQFSLNFGVASADLWTLPWTCICQGHNAEGSCSSRWVEQKQILFDDIQWCKLLICETIKSENISHEVLINPGHRSVSDRVRLVSYTCWLSILCSFFILSASLHFIKCVLSVYMCKVNQHWRLNYSSENSFLDVGWEQRSCQNSMNQSILPSSSPWLGLARH